MQRRRLPLGSVELAYSVYGPEHSRNTPLVMLHGYTGSRRDFADVADALSQDRAVHVIDQRGHGESTWLLHEDAYTFEALRDDAIAFLKRVCSRPVHLLGHSVGGQIAMRIALHAPQLVQSLILVSTWSDSIQFDPPPTLRRRILALPGFRQVVARIRDARGRRIDYPDNVDPAAYRGLRTQIQAADLSASLAELRDPLIVVGSDDVEFLPFCRSLATRIPGARLAELDHADHQVMSDAPQAFVATLRPRLAALDSDAGPGTTHTSETNNFRYLR